MTELNICEVEQVNGGLAFLLVPAFHYGVLTGGALMAGGIYLWNH